MKVTKRILGFLIIIMLLGVIAFNIGLYYQPKFKTYENRNLNDDLIQQLQHLKEELHHGAAVEMQTIYPEGFVFLNALYGLSWIEVAQPLVPESELFKEANHEIDWVLTELSSQNGLAVFNPNLEPFYGVFYRGWCNYLLGRKLMLFPASQRDTVELALFHKNCQELVAAFSNRESPFLESYSRACWPADMVVLMASVKIHSHLVDQRYEQDVNNWIQKVKKKTDSRGLIPHSSEWESGESQESSRGSSQSLILNFLIEIDSAFAKEQFEIYKNNFLDYRLGLPGVREYPKGKKAFGDVDSGPVIWGIGGAASIVGQRTMARFGESTIAIGLRNSIETFGLGNSRKGKKSYLFGQLPMADVFIAWSNSIEAYEDHRLTSEKNWRTKTQLISCGFLLLGSFIVFRLW